MRLSKFLVSHREQILSEWVTFARTRHANADAMDIAELRDHASEMLAVIAADLNTAQSKSEQVAKSEGKRDADPDSATPDTAAEAHGVGRAESGFNVIEMVSEYRALRATITRLWVATAGDLAAKDLEDLIRFNESIDQSLAESVLRFTRNVDHSREMFLGMMSHDLRTPLGAIIGWADVMVQAEALPGTLREGASHILDSGERMLVLLGDLLDLTRSRLGGGIPIVRADVDIGRVARSTIDEIAASHPKRVLTFEATGELQGHWDGGRVGQALSNLIGNAVQYGSETTPINVTMRGHAEEVALAVQNLGPVIPRNELNKIFDPMHRIGGDKPAAPTTNLGLGLYIAERIVAAHGGTIDVESSAAKGTTFTIHLPRSVRPEPPNDVAGVK